METLRQLLPSPSSLIVFEAAARCGSFAGAGLELGMSQAAVSFAIRKLEEDLGAQLFLREHRRATLTDAGSRFFNDVSRLAYQSPPPLYFINAILTVGSAGMVAEIKNTVNRIVPINFFINQI